MAAQLTKSVFPLALKPDYSEKELVGYTRPPLSSVSQWIQFEAQNMMELTWRMELACIREDVHVSHMMAMLIWF